MNRLTDKEKRLSEIFNEFKTIYENKEVLTYGNSIKAMNKCFEYHEPENKAVDLEAIKYIFSTFINSKLTNESINELFLKITPYIQPKSLSKGENDEIQQAISHFNNVSTANFSPTQIVYILEQFKTDTK